jgi:2-oxoglutarate ferredoxin oxidoreductase subunit gamma
MRLTEIRIAGFGGQGVILSAIVIGKAACIFDGWYATMTQSFGPEARGSVCSAQVILSDRPILYPYVTRPDVLVAMSQEAYTRFAPELKSGGLLIIEQDLVSVESHRDMRLLSVPATRLAEELGNRLVVNTVMVGFFGAVTSLLEPESLRKAIADTVPASFLELNQRAFQKGFECGMSAVPAMTECVMAS